MATTIELLEQQIEALKAQLETVKQSQESADPKLNFKCNYCRRTHELAPVEGQRFRCTCLQPYVFMKDGENFRLQYVPKD